ncbi:MAG: ArnT family glycosyltransferase, partial [Terrimicrobiaceae bacterium]
GTAGWGDLYNETDGQYGGAARVMAGGGSWLIPENNGVPRLVKPPLLYWTMAASMKIFGVNEFAARLPSALATVAWVAVTYLLGTRMGGTWRGFLAGAILLSSLGVFTLGRIVMPEPMFSALIAAALYCVLRGHDEAAQRRKWFAGFWLCAALASFTKGWHGLLYPLAIVGVAAMFCRSARPNLRGLLSWEGLLIFCAINLPWYFYIESRFPGYLSNLLFAEQIGHVTGSSAPATDYTNVPRWQFLVLHLAWFFPWSVVVLTGLWKNAGPRVPISPRPSIQFEAILIASWAAVILGSVLLAGQRQDYYAMAMWPAFALWAAALIEHRSLRPAAIFLTILFAAGFVMALAIPLFAPGAGTASVAERSTAWTTVTNFDSTVWQSLRTTALLTLGGATIFSLASVLLGGRRQIFALLAAAGCLALGALGGTSLVSPFFSLAQAAPTIIAGASAGSRLVYDGGIDTGSSLLFYTDLPLTLLDQNPGEDFLIRKFGIGRDRFLTTDQLAGLWKSGAPIILVTEAAKLPRWEEVLGVSLVPLTRCGTQVVLKN